MNYLRKFLYLSVLKNIIMPFKKNNNKEKIIKEFIDNFVSNFFLKEAEDEFIDQTKPQRKPGSSYQKPTGINQTQKFDFNHLKSLKDIPQILGYLQTTNIWGKQLVGQGRLVWKLGNGTALKVAQNQGGIGQNQAEVSVCKGDRYKILFPMVFDHDQNFNWILVEEASPINSEIWQQLTKGLNWEVFRSALRGAFPNKLKQSTGHQITNFNFQNDKENFIQAANNQFFASLIRIIKECGYEPGDLAKLDSWGIIKGRLVIIDSGFTEAVNQTHYK